MNDRRDEEIKVVAASAPKRDKRLIVLIVCLCVAVALAIGAVGGFIGHAIGKSNVTVIHSQDGNVSQLSQIDEVADSVVEIECTVLVQSGGGWFQRPTTYSATSAGSGVIISADGTIVTNHHVIDGATQIKVRLRNGEEHTASLVGSDQSHDIAVLKISAENLTYATFGTYELKVGQTVVVIGNPLGKLGGSVTDGIISALDRDISIDGATMRLLQTNASINSGNSGGGMFDLDGRLIGIVNAKSTGTDVEGLGFAIPADVALSVVTEILSA